MSARSSRSPLVFVLLLLAQVLLSNYFRVSPYLTISLLPVMILCFPIRVPTVGTLLAAFAMGLLVDFLTEGVLGLNALALLPVAILQKSILQLVFGNELFARNEDFTVQRNGWERLLLALFIVLAVYLAIYVWADSAGTRTFLFNLTRWGVSLLGSFLFSLPVLNILARDSRS